MIIIDNNNTFNQLIFNSEKDLYDLQSDFIYLYLNISI